MFMKEDIGEPLVMFEEDPENGGYTNKVAMVLFAMGEVMTPGGATVICRDKDGFEWRVRRSRISDEDGSEYGWVKKVYPRMLDGFDEYGRK